MQNKNYMGVIQSFTADPSNVNWLVLGTNLGYLCGWDIRFGIPFKEWRTPSKSPIYDIIPNQSLSSGNNHSIICASAPGDFQFWDLESGECKNIFISSDKIGVEEIGVQALPAEKDLFCDVNTTADTKVRAILNPKGTDILLSAGIDPILSFWDLSYAQNSFCFPSDTFNRSYTTYNSLNGINVYKKFEEPKRINKLEKSGIKEPSLGHRRIVTQLNYLEWPQKMILSGSRDGVIKIWR
jgi:WD40 repeat protein